MMDFGNLIGFRTRILWRKDQKALKNSKKYSISKKGALRIQEVVYSDSGIYTCLGRFLI